MAVPAAEKRLNFNTEPYRDPLKIKMLKIRFLHAREEQKNLETDFYELDPQMAEIRMHNRKGVFLTMDHMETGDPLENQNF